MMKYLFTLILLFQTLLLSSQNFSFVYLPDIHLRPDSAVTAGFQQMVSRVNKLHPDFVLTGGDMIYTAKTVNGTKAAVLFEYMDKEFKRFKMPVYLTMGNHENVGITNDSGIDKSDPDWGKQMFERRYNKRYYTFMYGGWKFFVLDGIKIREDIKDYTQGIDPEQVEWIRKELESTGSQTPVAISMHTPFVNPHAIISSESKVMSAVCDTVLRMFEKHDLRLVLEGHTHMYMNLFYHGTYYLSGGSTETSTDEQDHGFFHIRVKKGIASAEFINLP